MRSARLLLLVHTLLAGRSLADRALVIVPGRIVYDDNGVVIETRASRVHEPGDEFGHTVGDGLKAAIAANHQLGDGTVLTYRLSRGQPVSHGHPATLGPLLPDNGITEPGPRNRLAAPTVIQNPAAHVPIVPWRPQQGPRWRTATADGTKRAWPPTCPYSSGMPRTLRRPAGAGRRRSGRGY